METVFLVAALAGGTLVACQVLAGVLGFGADHDTDHDTGADHGHDAGHGNAFVGLLTVRTMTSALLFFGLGGLTAGYYGADEPTAFIVALAGGVAALVLVAQAMKSLARLKSDGTARVDRAIGRTGTVYLRIPGERSGPGKVHLMVQNRTVEYQAVTSGGELATGSPVKVVAVVSADTVEVVAA